MNDFWKGVIIFFLVLGAVVVFFNYIGRASVYNDNYKTSLMSACQTNGYTWGQCYNVIHGSKDAFDH